MHQEGTRRIVVVTGASGFVGSALIRFLAADQLFAVRACYRSAPPETSPGIEAFVVGDIGGKADWTAALAGADTIVHTAARAHVLDETDSDPLAAYRKVNVEGTMQLARAAVEAGVRRLVFLSTVKVNGESTPIDRPFTEADTPHPQDAYGQSKLEAEGGLWGIAQQTGLEVVVLRPPLIYGPGVKGNFDRLSRLVQRGVPIPFGAIRNKRSLIGLINLCSAIRACLLADAAAGHTFFVCDERPLSTPELVVRLAAALGLKAALWPVPVVLLRLAGVLTGRTAEIGRLTSSLIIDSTAITEQLGWRPEPAQTEDFQGLRADRER